MKLLKQILTITTAFLFGFCSLQAAEIEQIKEEMISEMKLAVKEIESKYQSKYGKIPFGRIFTNDKDIAKIVAKNGANIESVIPLEKLLDSRIAKIDALDKEIEELDKEIHSLENQRVGSSTELTMIQDEITDANKELIDLERKVAPLQELLTKLGEVLAAYNTGSLTSFSYKIEKNEVENVDIGEKKADPMESKKIVSAIAPKVENFDKLETNQQSSITTRESNTPRAPIYKRGKISVLGVM